MFRIYDKEGNILSEFEKEFTDGEGMSRGLLGDDGNIYCIYSQYGVPQGENGETVDLHFLQCYSPEGEEIWSLPLGEGTTADDWYYVKNSALDNDGNIILTSTKGIEVVKSDGTYVKNIAADSLDCNQIFVTGSGKTLVSVFGENGIDLYEVNLDSGKIGSSPLELPFDLDYYSFSSGTFSDLVLINENGIYTYSLGDEDLIKRMDFVESDIMSSGIYNIYFWDEEHFFALYYDEIMEGQTAAVFTKVAPEDVKDKKDVVLAGTYIGYDVRKDVVNFNKENEDYRIHIKDYSTYNTDNDYLAGTKKLNTDLASGEIPDILIADSSLPLDSYVNKGLFTDLYELMDGDPEIKKENYLQNVLDAFSKDGKLYRITPGFSIATVVGKAEDVGTTPGWNFDDLKTLMAKKGPDVQVFADVPASQVLSYSMTFGGAQYIDWKTGECRFDSEDFKNVLEFAKTFPAEIDYEALQSDEEYWEKYDTMYRDGRTLLSYMILTTFRDYNITEKGMFGADITPVGFPNEAKESGAIMMNNTYSISAKSDVKEGAWQFVRRYLTEEYQEQMEYALPVMKSVLEKQAAEAQKKPVMEDENGNMEEYDDTYYINGKEIIIPPMTKEETDELIQYISGVTKVYQNDMEVMTILDEECAPFFEGKKSADEVAKIIQSRVQIYVNENR